MSRIRMCVKRRPASRSRGGFTLIELLIVAAILVILLSIILATVKEAPELARRVSCRANLKQMVEGCHMWAKMRQDKFPTGQPATIPEGWVNSGAWGIYAVADVGAVLQSPPGKQAGFGYDPEGAQGAWMQHGVLAAARLCDPRLFYCPSWRDESSQWGTFVLPEGATINGGPVWPVWDNPSIVPAGQVYMWTSYHMRCTFPGRGASSNNSQYRAANKRIDKPYDTIFADCFAEPNGWGVDVGHVKGVNAARIAGNVTWFENTTNSSGMDRLMQNAAGAIGKTNWTAIETVFKTLSMD